MRLKIFRTLYINLLFSCLTIAQALANDVLFDPDKHQSIINIYEAVVTQPSPSWIKKGNPFTQSEFDRQQNGQIFMMQQVPKGETFQNWTTLYAVTGFLIGPTTPETFPLMLNLSIKAYVDTCGAENLSIQHITQEPTKNLHVLFCRHTKNGTGKNGYMDTMGTIALVHHQPFENTFIKIYQEWRGPRFTLEDAASWPVTKSDLNMMIDRFSKIHLTPANSAQ